MLGFGGGVGTARVKATVAQLSIAGDLFVSEALLPHLHTGDPVLSITTLVATHTECEEVAHFVLAAMSVRNDMMCLQIIMPRSRNAIYTALLAGITISLKDGFLH